ncbi:helix-turn-helix domain-containing protein [Actinomyces gaoshouyii]|uniref:Transcriptional regulator n=1 Tax=Actinomyces gaoshouyii TaxID=1960083 RepID=A0A8H9LI68_9ACTO|nr:helix-turn-helix transcriptional regulator [Actinomyces gaoshouyii]GGO95488.1 transcriptional regulator [Actinomyces gaoshouyii]
MSRSDDVAPPTADPRAQIKEFLTSRRARVTPDKVGLPVVGAGRRVPGLRREEVAMLAGVSVDYYTRLERGSLAGASAEVLESLASALLLDDAEREHLLDLARAVSPAGRQRRRARPGRRSALRPGTRWILDAMHVPAIVRDGLGRCLAANTLARALYAPLFIDPIPEIADDTPSLTRFMFLDPRAHDFFPHWDIGAEDSVAMLRLTSGADPTEPDLTALVGELSTRSRDFAGLWARHDVRYICRDSKVIHHPLVGEITLACEPAAMASSPGLTLVSYAAEPGSPSEEALRLLSSWAATESAAPVGQRDALSAPGGATGS